MTAVLVAHNGMTWLAEALDALRAQTCPPRYVVLVDTGSTDGSTELLRSTAADRPGALVVELPSVTGYGAAVVAGLAAAPAGSWLWLLHDDCAPAPDALERLLEQAQRDPGVTLLGPKVRDFQDPRVLVEVGLRTDGSGHRETGLERREYDQGQHDQVRDVLAVGTAGALIRREMWDRLGGLDPALPLYRDDLDLGWRVNAAGGRVVVVPAATVRHARAASTGRRQLDAVHGRPERVDRAHAWWVLLVHASAWRLPVVLARVVLTALGRSVAFLLTRQVAAAGDELLALLQVLSRPDRLVAAWRARARTRRRPRAALRPLFSSPAQRRRTRMAALASWLSGGAALAASRSSLAALVEAPDEAEDLPAAGSGLIRRTLVRPGVVLGLGLVLVALLAQRRLLLGAGPLVGGRLLPAPDGAAAVWAQFVGSWHPAAVGSGAPAPPGRAVFAALSYLLAGKAWLAQDLLLLGCVPLGGVTAYWAAGRFTRQVWLRVWVAATWALLPTATGAVAVGRLDAAAVQVGLPLLAVPTVRLFGSDTSAHRGSHRLRSGLALGLGLTVLTALAPTLWLPAAVVLICGGLVRLVTARGDATRVLAPVLAAAVPALLLVPFWPPVLREPGLLLHGPGPLDVGSGSSAVAGDAAPYQLMLLWPGGAGLPPTALFGGVLLAALAGLMRRDRAGLARGGWAVALVGLAVALALTRIVVPPPGGRLPLPVWPGVALQVAAAGLLLAALVAADKAREALAGRSFGWLQISSAVVLVAAVAAPVGAAASWIATSGAGLLSRDGEPLLPAFARAELAAEPGARVLVLRPAVAGEASTVAYEVTGPEGPRSGITEVPPAAYQVRQLDEVVADLLAPRGSDAAPALATRGVRYVALPATAQAQPVAEALDQQAGLIRRSSEEVILWRVTSPAARLTLLPPASAEAAAAGERAPSAALQQDASPVALSSVPGPAPWSVHAPVGPGQPGRMVVLAEAADPGWRATLDGRPLARRTAWGWAQGFALPPEGGLLEVARDESAQHRARWLQGALVLLVIVLAAPPVRRRRRLGVGE